MHSGHLLDLKITIAFSVEKLSLGRPSICQALIATGSPRTAGNEYFGEEGIFLCRHCATQSLRISVLYEGVNAPRYPMSPELTRTSPVSVM